jgi:hypothetical protein
MQQIACAIVRDLMARHRRAPSPDAIRSSNERPSAPVSTRTALRRALCKVIHSYAAMTLSDTSVCGMVPGRRLRLRNEEMA